MKIAICDDTLQDRQTIVRHLADFAAKTGTSLVPNTYESGEALLAALKKTSFELIFLDIYMLALNGIETAHAIRKFDKNVQIIFVTTSPDHAISSYDVRALHYLMKPITYSKLERVLSLCQLESIKASRQIEVSIGNQLIPINLADIIYAEMFKKVLTIHTTHGAKPSISEPLIVRVLLPEMLNVSTISLPPLSVSYTNTELTNVSITLC